MDRLARRFEENRDRLRSVAYRILGSLTEAEDAVQEGWVRLARSDPNAIDNLDAWLTTVVSRVCLDMLRSRRSRREEPSGSDLEAFAPDRASAGEEGGDPEAEAVLADSVGLALLVVLNTLSPAERTAFVLHDMFDLRFEEIGEIIGRSPSAARQLASRGRRRVRGERPATTGDVVTQRRVVDAYLDAARRGDLTALLAVLDPDVVVRADRWAVPPGVPLEARGARVVAERAIRGAARWAQRALVAGRVGIVVAPHGRLDRVLMFTISDGAVREIEVVADPDRLRGIEVRTLPDA